MLTKKGVYVSESVRGIVYLCSLEEKLIVNNELLCDSAFEALNLYANIPNPESQLVQGKTHEELVENLLLLHENMEDPEWLEELRDCL